MPYKIKSDLYAAQKRYRGRRKELFDIAMRIIEPIYTDGLSKVKAELDKLEVPSFAEIQKAVQARGLDVSEEVYESFLAEAKENLEKLKARKIEKYNEGFTVMAREKIREAVELKLMQENKGEDVKSMIREEVRKHLWDAIVDQTTERINSKIEGAGGK
jgi:hypothetical protein